MIDVLAFDVLRKWLEAEGFTLQAAEGREGYWVASTSRLDFQTYEDRWHRALVRYRGGGGIVVKQKLEAVASRLDELGVSYEWADLKYNGKPTYPGITVVVTPWETMNPESGELRRIGTNPLPRVK